MRKIPSTQKRIKSMIFDFILVSLSIGIMLPLVKLYIPERYNFLFFIFLGTIYGCISNGIFGKTAGKALFQLKIIKDDNSRFGLKESFSRYSFLYILLALNVVLIMILPNLPDIVYGINFAFFIFNFFIIFSNSKNKLLHDYFAKTTIIDISPVESLEGAKEDYIENSTQRQKSNNQALSLLLLIIIPLALIFLIMLIFVWKQ